MSENKNTNKNTNDLNQEEVKSVSAEHTESSETASLENESVKNKENGSVTGENVGETEDPFTDETAFNREFDPSHAVFTHMDDTLERACTDDTADNGIPADDNKPVVSAEEEPVFERAALPTSKTERIPKIKGGFFAGRKLFNKNKREIGSAETKPKLSKATLLTAGIAAVVVVLVTVIILAANGLIPVFASEDIYGIFVEGNLVAASNSRENIEEAIDDFMSYYRTLEEQGSLTNLHFSQSYEIRELTRDEIKENIYKSKKGASSTSEVTEATNTEKTEEAEQEAKEQGGSNETTSSESTTKQLPPRSTFAMQTDDSGKTFYPTTNQENPLNRVDGKIAVSKNTEELQNVLFYGEAPEIYTVVEGDNISKIAKRQGLTLTELMVPNPDLLEDSTIGIEQEIKIVRMSGPLKLSFSREVTTTEDIDFKTVEEKTNELYVGETRVSQQGKEGIRQEVAKYDYENNLISVRTPVSNEVMEQPTNKIVQIGTKPKTSPAQSTNTASSAPVQTSSSGFAWPVSGARLSSRFGPRRSPKRGASSYHRGIDLAISSGTPIRAAKGGTVTISSRTGGYGNLVEINHGGGLTTRYGHCSVLKVKRGQKVNKGDVIALVGSTGVSTGPHLHFEVRKGGTAVNPLGYLK